MIQTMIEDDRKYIFRVAEQDEKYYYDGQGIRYPITDCREASSQESLNFINRERELGHKVAALSTPLDVEK